MGESTACAAVVAAVVSLCRALDIAVVAEGIEQEAQQSQLASLGCDFGQGYLLGRPGRLDLTTIRAAG
jgi:EAL domain-containing protein (putative c-di-GMP-specific phosphodiesterase class I)